MGQSPRAQSKYLKDHKEITQHLTLMFPSQHMRSFSTDDILTGETAGLLRSYQEGIGVWMDIFDSSHTYQNEVVRHSLSSPLLMHAACALSAKQMSLTQNKFLWEPVSSRFYGKSLSLLINDLTEQSTDRELLLAATILLCSYELLAQPGIDYQRHLYGAHTLISSRNIDEEGTAFEKASFWIYARQDVALALVNERPTLMPPAKWPTPTKNAGSLEDRVGNKILWMLAMVMEAKFKSANTNWTDTELTNFESLVSEIDSCWAGLPSHVRGVRMKDALLEEESLFRVWFCTPSASALCLYYHMAKILAYECLLERLHELPPRTERGEELLRSIGPHARSIASTSLSSDLTDGALVVAVNPIFYGNPRPLLISEQES
ncbi:uncharacterized protein N7496_005862 [Penicillium cataractarum]|uniref:Transcription factor domain-containing protein n=1 Tax=Penicillium cataractarum TaxID=2100454 RepID=A0A9W9S0P4_9EURO|nr:uncharacterized protein N7496_005862 [Penicillium cataractarum]KAJ5369770.1 hypothetical protein N7496_005862 [Penicillium cataractarum]